MEKSQKNGVTEHVRCYVRLIWMMTLHVKTQNKRIFDAPFLADNKDAFRKYRGVEILIKVLREYKSAAVVKAIIHVITGNSKI